jgi:hypothetical protein
VRGSIFKAAQWAFACVLSVLLFLPLISVFRHAEVTLTFKALLISLFALTLARPAAGVLALAVLLPLALAIRHFLGPEPAASEITEAFVLAFGSAAALRLTGVHPDARDRLSRPALIFGAVIASSAVVALVADQAANPARDILADVWRQFNGRYLFVARPFTYVHLGLRWIAVLALAVYVERAIRRQPGLASAVVRMFLVGGAAAASFAALRLATILIEGRIDPDRLAIVAYLIREVRITALHGDPNAAGSYFALFLIPALVIGLRQRNWWMLASVTPLIGLAFLLAQSRAALLAVGVIPAIMAASAFLKARRYGLVIFVLVALFVLGIAARIITGPSHASLGRAAVIRQELSRVALDMARDHPAFGVGVGRFVASSRSYIDEYPVLRRWAPRGQNAHNNFLQILAELGIPAFVAFLWLVVPAARRWPWESASAPEGVVYASALAAGLATFLLSAVFGHPLLIIQVAAAFFFALGLTAGILAPPAGSGFAGRVVTIGALVVLVLTLPWRMHQVRASVDDETGVGDVAGTLDGVSYQVADAVSSWQVPSDAGVVILPLRWQASSPADCTVDVVFDGQVADRARPDAALWKPLQFRVPGASSGSEPRVLELRVSDANCTLLVGPLQVLD